MSHLFIAEIKRGMRVGLVSMNVGLRLDRLKMHLSLGDAIKE